MGLFKYATLGEAVVVGIKYVSKKRKSDGKSVLNDFTNHINLLLDEASAYKEKVKRDYKQTTALY